MIRIVTDDVERVLSHRELEVFKLMAEGMTNEEIAQRMFRSPKTVSSHLKRITDKLGVKNAAQVRVVSAILFGKLEVTHEFVEVRLRPTSAETGASGSDRDVRGRPTIKLQPLAHPLLRPGRDL